MSVTHNTPEGAPVGLVKNMSLSTSISISMNSVHIRELLAQHGTLLYNENITNRFEYLKNMGNEKNVMIVINGDIIGYNKNPVQLYDTFKGFKRSGYIYPMTSIVWNIKQRNIAFSTESGRMYRPLLIVDNNELRINKILKEKNISFKEFSDGMIFDSFICPDIHISMSDKTDYKENDTPIEGFIEYMDLDEINTSMIAMFPGDLEKGIKGVSMPPTYTHCEIHPSLMNGVLGVNIPFSDYNQSPRNCYQCAMGKQALGIYMSNFNNRMDTIGNILNYPQRPIVNTKLGKYTHTDDMPSGINAIVAIASYTGFNQEDSVMINQSAVERGLFTSTYYKSFREQCSKNHSTGEEEIFTKIDEDDISKPYNYDKLGKDGFVPVNTYVQGGDVFIGKVMPRKINGVIKQNDMSVAVKPNDDGYIDMNYTDYNQEAYKFAKVRIRKYRVPEIGDKLASRSAQKGTIGMRYSQQDMPFTKDGIVPDIILNPHAIPSRMTIGQLMESVLGKVCCMEGICGDSTPYNKEKVTINNIGATLEKYGLERYGNEILYDARSGQQIKTEIFIGPTYYQRLKHMVCDKIHSRGSNGPIVLITRQPSEGRSRLGGLRLGEMERDAVIGHGAACFLKERLINVSDDSKQFVCMNCGFIGISNPDKDLYRCDFCKNDASISQVRIPYSFKLFIQELNCMNICLRLGL